MVAYSRFGPTLVFHIQREKNLSLAWNVQEVTKESYQVSTKHMHVVHEFSRGSYLDDFEKDHPKFPLAR